MYPRLDIEWRYLFGLCLLSSLLGWTLGLLWEGLSLGLIVYILYSRIQANKFARWLRDNKDENLTQFPGYWTALSQQVASLQREEKRLQGAQRKQIKRLLTVTAALKDGIVLLDGDYTLDWWNTAASRILGLSTKDRNRPLTNLMRMPIFVKYIQQPKYDKPIILELPGEETVTIRVQAVKLRKGGKGRIGIQISDVSRLVHLESVRKDFVANMSHELKTPLTVIRGYVEALPQMVPNDPKIHGVFSELQKQTDRIQHLITDLLYLAEIESGAAPQTRPIDVNTLLNSVIQDARELCGKKHKITFKSPRSFEIMATEKDLYSAFSNLVVNAIRHNPKGCNIVIKTHRDATSRIVTIKDNGVGIDEQHLPRITERFYRVDPSRNAATGGTGLGLSIVKHILNRHHGQLDITSTLGSGTRCRCIFPDSDAE